MTRQDILLNPLVIVEVLSASTEAYDRGEKFEHYQSIGSLSTYVLVAQDVPPDRAVREARGQQGLDLHRIPRRHGQDRSHPLRPEARRRVRESLILRKWPPDLYTDPRRPGMLLAQR